MMTFICPDCLQPLSQTGTNKMRCESCDCTFMVTVTIEKVVDPYHESLRQLRLSKADDGPG